MNTRLCALALLIALASAAIITVNPSSTQDTPISTVPTGTNVIPKKIIKLPFYSSANKPRYQSVDLRGDYSTNIKSNPNMVIRLSKNEFELLNGCNRVTGRYQADVTGSIQFLNIVSTKKACTKDFDSHYRNALSKAALFVKNGNQIVLKEKKGFETITLTLVGDKTPVVDTLDVLIGTYSTNIERFSKVKIQFTETQVIMTGGCNSQNAEYKAFSNGTFSVSAFASTKLSCSVDNDKKYTDAFSQAIIFYKNSDGSVRLMGDKAKVVAILTPASLTPKEVKFDNTYETNIQKNNDITVKFDSQNKVQILNGCNTHAGTYKAKDDSLIEFSAFVSTKKYCDVDNDAFYTKPLLASVNFIQDVNSKRMAFYDETGKLTLVLTPSTKKDLCANVKCDFGTKCENGKCTVAVSALIVPGDEKAIISAITSGNLKVEPLIAPKA